MPVTDEQNVIIGFKPTPGSIVSVQAYAGSGKTFTLKEFADANPSLKILYIVFNKAIKDDAKRNSQKTSSVKHLMVWP
jgi:DNA transposition AAA+ family ATPase